MDNAQENAMTDLLNELTADDDSRDYPNELKELMERTGAVPDADTRAATLMLYQVALALLESGSPKNNGKFKVIDARTGKQEEVDGIPEMTKMALRGGAFIVALGRDENTDSPMDSVKSLLASISVEPHEVEANGDGPFHDLDKKNRVAMFKKALDAVRKGRNVTFEK